MREKTEHTDLDTASEQDRGTAGDFQEATRKINRQLWVVIAALILLNVSIIIGVIAVVAWQQDKTLHHLETLGERNDCRTILFAEDEQSSDAALALVFLALNEADPVKRVAAFNAAVQKLNDNPRLTKRDINMHCPP